MQHQPVRDAFELETLDKREMLAGYRAGLAGMPETPHDRCTRAYWHGWRNGMTDGGHRQPDEAQQALAADMFPRERTIH